MFNIDVEEITWGGQTLRLETGRVARQADGAIFASLGETTVLATATATPRVRAPTSGQPNIRPRPVPSTTATLIWPRAPAAP